MNEDQSGGVVDHAAMKAGTNRKTARRYLRSGQRPVELSQPPPPSRGQFSLQNVGNRHAVRATTRRLYFQSIFGTSTQRRSLHDFRPSSASWTPLAPCSKFQGNGSPLTTCFRKSSHCTLKALS